MKIVGNEILKKFNTPFLLTFLTFSISVNIKNALNLKSEI